MWLNISAAVANTLTSYLSSSSSECCSKVAYSSLSSRMNILVTYRLAAVEGVFATATLAAGCSLDFKKLNMEREEGVNWRCLPPYTVQKRKSYPPRQDFPVEPKHFI